MATLSGTITSVANFDTPSGPLADSSGNQVWNAMLHFTISGTYVQADDAQLTGVPAAIRSRMANGKTPTLLSAMFAAPGDEAGTPIGAGPVITVSGTSLTFPLTGGDLSTEHAGAVLGTLGKPIALRVCFTCAG